MQKDLSWLKHDFIAHRGLYQKDQSIAENSKKAFELAMLNGYSIELDVNLLKDDTVLVFHDHNFKRLCGINLYLKDVTYEQSRTYVHLTDQSPLMTLEDLLDFVDGKVPLLIELKPKGDVIKLTESVMKALDNYKGKFALFSFHPKVLFYLKKHHNYVIRGQISSFFNKEKMNFVSKYLMKSMFLNRFTKPDFISYDITNMPNKFLDKAKRKGTTIISYAAKNQKEFDMVKSHYDNVVFEFFTPLK